MSRIDITPDVLRAVAHVIEQYAEHMSPGQESDHIERVAEYKVQWHLEQLAESFKETAENPHWLDPEPEPEPEPEAKAEEPLQVRGQGQRWWVATCNGASGVVEFTETGRPKTYRTEEAAQRALVRIMRQRTGGIEL